MKQLLLICFLVLLPACYAGMQTKGNTFINPKQIQGLDESFQAKRYALLIGINKFHDPQWPDLKFATKDAFDMAAMLEGFDYVRLLTSPEETNLENITQAIHDIGKRTVDPNDTVLVYISSHGTLQKLPASHFTNSNGFLRYIVTHDTRNDDIAGSALPVQELTKQLSQLRSTKKALILATCYSGTGKSAFSSHLQHELSYTKGSLFVRPLKEVSEATIVLSASGWGETAQEDKHLKNDIYTHFFIEGLAVNDRDQDGAISISEAHDYARYRTYYYTQGRQRPSMVSTVLGMDPIFLRGEKTKLGKPLVYSYNEGLDGIEIEVDGLSKGVLPGGVAVNTGETHIVLRDPRGSKEILSETLTLQAGQSLDIVNLLPKKIEFQFDIRPQFTQAVIAPESIYQRGPTLALCANVLHIPKNEWLLEACLEYSQSQVGLQISHEELQGDSYLASLSIGIGRQIPISLLTLKISGGIQTSIFQRQLQIGEVDKTYLDYNGFARLYATSTLLVKTGETHLGIGLSINYSPILIDSNLEHGLFVSPYFVLAFY